MGVRLARGSIILSFKKVDCRKKKKKVYVFWLQEVICFMFAFTPRRPCFHFWRVASEGRPKGSCWGQTALGLPDRPRENHLPRSHHAHARTHRHARTNHTLLAFRAKLGMY